MAQLICKRRQAQPNVRVREAFHIAAITARDASQNHDSRDERREDAEIHKGNKIPRVARGYVEYQCDQSPNASKYADDEQNKDECWCEEIRRCVAMDKVGEHADQGNEEEELDAAPCEEEYAGDHDGGVGRAVIKEIRSRSGMQS